MNTSQANLDRVRDLLGELQKLEEAKEVYENYDRKIFAEFYSQHNNNRSSSKSVILRLPKELEESIFKWVKEEIQRVKKELEKV